MPAREIEDAAACRQRQVPEHEFACGVGANRVEGADIEVQVQLRVEDGVVAESGRGPGGRTRMRIARGCREAVTVGGSRRRMTTGSGTWSHAGRQPPPGG